MTESVMTGMIAVMSAGMSVVMIAGMIGEMVFDRMEGVGNNRRFCS